MPKRDCCCTTGLAAASEEQSKASGLAPGAGGGNVAVWQSRIMICLHQGQYDFLGGKLLRTSAVHLLRSRADSWMCQCSGGVPHSVSFSQACNPWAAVAPTAPLLPPAAPLILTGCRHAGRQLHHAHAGVCAAGGLGDVPCHPAAAYHSQQVGNTSRFMKCSQQQMRAQDMAQSVSRHLFQAWTLGPLLLPCVMSTQRLALVL